MLDDHGEIVRLFEEFKENVGKGFIQMADTFKKFVFQVESHMVTEEKVICIIQNLPDKEFLEMAEKLKEEHDKILKMMKTIQTDISSKMDVNISTFERFFEDHRDFEEDSFYPRIDAELNDRQKKSIIESINSISKSQRALQP
jgi:hemerythrin superfamily protein